jgi:hypothetical protein
MSNPFPNEPIPGPSEQFLKVIEGIRLLTPGEVKYLVSFLLLNSTPEAARPSLQGPALTTMADALLTDVAKELQGPEMVLLAGAVMRHGSELGIVEKQEFESRDITAQLRRYRLDVANITTATESAVRKKWLASTEDRGKGAHRSYLVTDLGLLEIERLGRIHREKLHPAA